MEETGKEPKHRAGGKGVAGAGVVGRPVPHPLPAPQPAASEHLAGELSFGNEFRKPRLILSTA